MASEIISQSTDSHSRQTISNYIKSKVSIGIYYSTLNQMIVALYTLTVYYVIFILIVYLSILVLKIFQIYFIFIYSFPLYLIWHAHFNEWRGS